MSNVLEYTLSLQDQISAKLQKIGITSDNALNKFGNLQLQSKKTSQLLKDMGSSVGSLRDKLNLLKSEKEWIPSSNLQSIRKYNTEIKNLEKEITKLDTINGSAFKRNLKGAISNLPFADLITNPVAQAGVALFQSTKMAMSFDEGMAKINTTAQLSSSGVTKLKYDIMAMGRDAGADLSVVPSSFEKILSQTNDVALSQDILKVALKGSKAGFTDLDTVSAAVAQTLSLVGKENTNAKEVMDTLFAAKRVGAGEFKDFAQYIPGLVASGQALGKGFKETSGVFAYMTAKGQSAENSAMLIQNAYTALGKTKITKGLEKSGVSVFNKDGSMKQMDEIFASLDKKMKSFGKNDQAKTSYLQNIGLVDAQAKQAFMVLSSESGKLKDSLTAVKNSTGETDKAFEKSQNAMQKLAKMWSNVQAIAVSVGDILGIVLAPILIVVAWSLGKVTDATMWFSKELQNGNPWILAALFAVSALALAHAWNTREATFSWVIAKKNLIVDKAQAFWKGVLAAKTTLLTGAQWLLNIAMDANPVGLIVLGIIALIAVVTVAIQKYDSFGAGLLLLMGPIGMFINAIMAIKDHWDSITNAFNNGGIIAGLKRIAVVLMDVLLKPLQQILEMIPGMSGMANSIKGLRTKMDLVTPGEKVVAVTKKTETTTGIAAAKIPGITPKGLGAGGGGKKDNTKTNEAIATGGAKNTVVHISIKDIVGIRTNILNGTKETINKVGDEIADGILRTLAMAQTAAS